MQEAHRPSVLVVDDDEQILAATARFLRGKGLSVVASSSSLGVSQLVRQHAPEVVILDVEMPALNGDSLAKLIRANRGGAALPIVFYSGTENDPTKHLMDAVEGALFVHKSEGPEALLAAIVRLAGHASDPPAASSSRRPPR